jgi:hypothetical protein
MRECVKFHLKTDTFLKREYSSIVLYIYKAL